MVKYYDNPYWEFHLPVNPPGAYFREGFDVMMTDIELGNWDTDGGFEYRPRLREEVTLVNRFGLALETEAPEIDYDDDGFDCG